MKSSLFLKVYLTLLASLVVLAMASGAFLWLSNDEEDRSWSSRRDAILSAMLPSDATPAETQIVLDRLGEAFDADIAIFDANGEAQATVGEPPSFPPPGERRKLLSSKGHRFTVQLEDGRVLVARAGTPFGAPRGSPLVWLALIAGVTALAAWPVVRHLTRRLEGLRHGVEAWGEGDLSRRVPVHGKDEVAAVAASFNNAAARIEQLVTSHRSLLANASHELRSPLARLRMASDLYGEQPEERHRREIIRNLAELDELVEEILLASRLDHVENLELTDRVDLLALAAEEGARHGIPVTGEAVIVSGNARLLGRLARNLMQNALRHGAPPVAVEVTRADGLAELSVRDHGAGIAQIEGDRLFEPFYRPSGRGEAAGGWGLGLALVRQIAGRHHGTVRHETPPDGGARFVVTLPAASE